MQERDTFFILTSWTSSGFRFFPKGGFSVFQPSGPFFFLPADFSNVEKSAMWRNGQKNKSTNEGSPRKVAARKHHQAIGGGHQVGAFHRGLVEQADARIARAIGLRNIHFPMVIGVFQQVEVCRFVAAQVNAVKEAFFPGCMVDAKLGVRGRRMRRVAVPVGISLTVRLSYLPALFPSFPVYSPFCGAGRAVFAFSLFPFLYTPDGV